MKFGTSRLHVSAPITGLYEIIIVLFGAEIHCVRYEQREEDEPGRRRR
jgi:hypothetical protein